MKTVLATIGLVVVLGGAYFFATGKKPELPESLASSQNASENAFATDASANKVKAAAVPATSSGNANAAANVPAKPRTPLDWTMEEIQAQPEVYFSYALDDAKKKRADIRAKEAQLRIKEKEFARKATQKKETSDGLSRLLEKAKAAYNFAEKKYAAAPTKWVAQFPDPGTKLKKPQMKMQIVRIGKRSKQAAELADKYLGVNQRYQNNIVVAEQKGFELDMAIDDLSNNLERIRANEALASISVNQEEINKYLDMSSVYNEMEDMSKALDDLAVAEGVMSANDAEFEKLMAE